jgi:hypothetical protein
MLPDFQLRQEAISDIFHLSGFQGHKEGSL